MTDGATPATGPRILAIVALLAAAAGAAVWAWKSLRGPTGPSDPWFVDRASAAGIAFRTQFLPTEQGENFKINLYDHGSGVAVADFDGDGRDDLYFCNQLGPNALYRNLGDGRFGAEMSERWWVERGPNGGYVAAVILRAIQAAAALKRAPRSLTVQFPRAPVAGPVAAAAAIVVFTIAIRLALVPLSYYAIRGQAAQARLRPQVQDLRRRFAGQPDLRRPPVPNGV